MSSLHQDRLLDEGSEPVTGTDTTLPTTRATPRRTVGDSGEKATSTVSTQRPGKAQRTGTPPSTAAPARPRARRATGAEAAALGGTIASRARAATAKVATAKAATAKAATAKAATVKAATAKAATVKSATAKAATAKAVTAKAATAARSAAVKSVANRAPGVRGARLAAASVPATAAAKPTTASKPAPAAKAASGRAASATAASGTAASGRAASATAASGTAASAKAASGTAASPAGAGTSAGTRTTGPASAVRPTPYRRTPAAGAAPSDLVPLTEVPDLTAADTTDVVVVHEAPPAGPAVGSAPGPRLPLFLRSRPPLPHRRPALYLAAAMAAAISLSAFTPEEPTAQATATVSQSVSVAEQLGIEAARPDAVVDATERLGELAATRNIRDAEQAAAAQAQAEADRIAAEAAAAAAAEAARPKAVLPVQGARLTSGFGARWGTLHAGIDLAAPMHTPEYAVMDGVVLEAGPASGYGLAVYIQHENGDVTVYGHMDQILVEAGQVVRAGDTIALLGNRGQSTGPHLHFEVHVGGLDGQKVDPLPWLRARGVDI